ncbi:glycoside hydrolase domain-containing protein [Granulicella cerasi]|uniref:Glycoside hydrolase domain-containing protein n=1 Tax=Granulicella cerasi TaxID=741063 RepID=A0ABW1Z3M5_9BACT|nr:glycoside hydrolase domain-containing protein [Granulicella cerasi]
MALALMLASAGRAQSVASVEVEDMKQVSATSGWVLASHRLYWSDSAGSQWAEITPQASTNVVSAYFNANGSGWALQADDEGSTLRLDSTQDKGAHWSTTTVSSPFTEALVFNGKSSLQFTDAAHGWMMLGVQSSSAFRRGILLQTVDGGAHWTQTKMPPVGGEIQFSDATHGFVGPGPNGDDLFRTTDAGESWTAVTLPAIAGLDAVSSTVTLPVFTGAQSATLLRTIATQGSTTSVRYFTSDGGAHWSAETSKGFQHAPAALAADATLATNLTWTGSVSNAGPTAMLAQRSSFTSTDSGWVLFAGGSCSAQGECTTSQSLMGTADGGKSFHALGVLPGLTVSSASSFKLSPKGRSSQISPMGSAPQPQSSYPVTGVMGFDACSLPTTTQLNTWWTGSPYQTVGVYIGGANFACKSGLANLTSTYVSTVLAQGWEIVPIWVGMQAPGGSFSSMMSTSPATAQTQGASEADSAIGAMAALGMGQGSTIVFDLEAYTYTNATYLAATQAFLEGWNAELHAKGYLSAVYSSHNEFNGWIPTIVTPAIDTIWYAYFFSSGVACGTTCQTVYPTASAFTAIAPYWLNHHRSRQTSSSFNSTYNGLTLNIDEDYTDAAFEVATPITLTATKAGSGKGTIATTSINNSLDTSSYTAISCGPTCTSGTAQIAATDTVVLTATPASGAIFSGWSGCSSTSGATCTITTAVNATVTATFAPVPTYALTITKTGTGSGTVVSSDNYINCGTTCTAQYPAGSTVTLTATPSTTSAVGVWTGCTTSTGSTCNITTGSSAATVSVSFKSFTAAINPAAVSIVGGKSSTATVTITPDSGYIGTFSTFACSGLPAVATCAFSPTSLSAIGDGAALTTTVTITTTPVFSAFVSYKTTMVLAGLTLPALLLLPFGVARRKTMRRTMLSLTALALLGGLGSITGCSPGNPAPYDTVAPGSPFSGTVYVTFNTAAGGSTKVPLQLTVTAK